MYRYVLFFNAKGPVAQILMSLDNLMPEFVKYYNNDNTCPRTGTRGIHLLHDNASAHKSAMVKEYLKTHGIKILPHPP